MALRSVGLKSTTSSGADEDFSPEIMSEINITPLTDVFLVLLIIFMVTSSVMSQMGVDVNLPKASESLSQGQPDGVIVTLLPNGAMKINERSIRPKDWNQFERVLKKIFESTQTRLVILEGDQSALLGTAIELMDHARAVGASNFAIATTPNAR